MTSDSDARTFWVDLGTGESWARYADLQAAIDRDPTGLPIGAQTDRNGKILAFSRGLTRYEHAQVVEWAARNFPGLVLRPHEVPTTDRQRVAQAFDNIPSQIVPKYTGRKPDKG